MKNNIIVAIYNDDIEKFRECIECEPNIPIDIVPLIYELKKSNFLSTVIDYACDNFAIEQAWRFIKKLENDSVDIAMVEKVQSLSKLKRGKPGYVREYLNIIKSATGRHIYIGQSNIDISTKKNRLLSVIISARDIYSLYLLKSRLKLNEYDYERKKTFILKFIREKAPEWKSVEHLYDD